MSDSGGIKVLGICGSLRKGSFNMAALRTAIELKPAGMSVEVADISQIPLYNEDVRAQGFPPPVQKLREQIAGADALLFACPEYNYSMSGVLKNAIDWASRPANSSPLAGKPLAGKPLAGYSAPLVRSCTCARSVPRSICSRSTSPKCGLRAVGRSSTLRVT